MYINQETGDYITRYVEKLPRDLSKRPCYQKLHHSFDLHEILTESKLQHLQGKIEQDKHQADISKTRNIHFHNFHMSRIQNSLNKVY